MEVNFDGLVGPTHHYAGLAHGNLASERNQHKAANPKLAALQGLNKMRWLHNQGMVQAVLPPQWRPNFSLLHQLGFQGSEQAVLSRVFKQAPQLLSIASSASAMWTANAATVAPSSDTENTKVCLTPANLIGNAHRSMEADANYRLFQHVFANENVFCVNAPLPKVSQYSDEGAANHMRIGLEDQAALHVFVYGRDQAQLTAGHFPARQTRQASEAVARLNHLDPAVTLFVQQTPQAIDAGVFHNDVIALSHTGLLLCHQRAFVNAEQVYAKLQAHSRDKMNIIEIRDQELPLADAVSSYLFNSQIITTSLGQLKMLLPQECREQPAVYKLIEHRIKADAGLAETHYLDLRQSMKNGGGPACLRLRIDLTPQQIQLLRGKLIVNDDLLHQLEILVEQRYPEEMSVSAFSSWPFCQSLMDTVVAIYELLDLPESLLHPI